MSPMAAQLAAVECGSPLRAVGRVESMGGLTVNTVGLALPVGSMCKLTSSSGVTSIAEVIGFHRERAILMPLGEHSAIAPGDCVENVMSAPLLQCSSQMLGRVLDGLGHPIDKKGPLPLGEPRRIDTQGTPALQRPPICQPLATGIRAVDALLTCGLGQRMAIFSGPGIGKSTLLSAIARNSSADVCVVALVGERAREVQEFMDKGLGAAGMSRCVVVVSTSDQSPLLCVRAAKVAATAAEYFRDQGKNVLLVVDSLTRLCHAQRQIGLAAHEPPATRGYPPSVFALLPKILERAGTNAVGSITAFYSVLVEGDEFSEPIADAVRGVADGHLWLSRALASKGHFPAIDILQSISRVRESIIANRQLHMARRILGILSVFEEIKDIIAVGAYVAGTNSDYDVAVQARPKILEFLQQETSSRIAPERSLADLEALSAWIDQLETDMRKRTTRAVS